MDSAGLEVLSEQDCLQMLASVPIGRIVFSDRALPAIQPVNFAVRDRSVIIQTGARSRLAIAATESVVAFEVDEFADGLPRTGWSVVAVGRASQVVDNAELACVRQLGLKPWVPGTKDYYLRVEIEVVSGRRLTV